eukprot:GHVU01199824.1.p1 GENE.GHVU01199824.1~~GHVU01199824.1.p1  ORF type:complete len:764 (-),score=101.03 GHVU01199824.1:1060-3351(-)
MMVQLDVLVAVVAVVVSVPIVARANSCSVVMAPEAPISGKTGVERLMDESVFNAMFPFRHNSGCNGLTYFTWANFVAASQFFPKFASTGTDAASVDRDRRELAAFLGQTSQETTGGWSTATCSPHHWGYCFKKEVNGEQGSGYCAQGDPCQANNYGYSCVCVPGKQYFGRGPIQLSWNYNYAQFSSWKFGDANRLLRNPDELITDPVLGWQSALWFWTTAQGQKPSCSDALTGVWQPTAQEAAAGRTPGFGSTTNIINGGLECGTGAASPNNKMLNRVDFYKRYRHILRVSAEAVANEVVTCNCMAHYTQGLTRPPGCSGHPSTGPTTSTSTSTTSTTPSMCNDPTEQEAAIPSKTGVERLVSETVFNAMFKFRDQTYYTYRNFVSAANKFASFCNSGTDATATLRDKRELAAFFAQTGAMTANEPSQQTHQCAAVQNGYSVKDENDLSTGTSAPSYCEPNNPCEADKLDCTCVDGKSYRGRGPAMLRTNPLYAKFSNYKYSNTQTLLNNPDAISQDGELGFESAIWHWTTQTAKGTKWESPTCSAVMQRQWTPTQEQTNAGLQTGYGMTTNIIAGKRECGTGKTSSGEAKKRAEYYQRTKAMINAVVAGESEVLGCKCMPHVDLPLSVVSGCEPDDGSGALSCDDYVCREAGETGYVRGCAHRNCAGYCKQVENASTRCGGLNGAEFRACVDKGVPSALGPTSPWGPGFGGNGCKWQSSAAGQSTSPTDKPANGNSTTERAAYFGISSTLPVALLAAQLFAA